MNDYKALYENYNADDFEIKGCPSQKDIWWQIIQILPSSYNQKRTVTMNYENILNIIEQRTGHKLDEWNRFITILEDLPYTKDLFNRQARKMKELTREEAIAEHRKMWRWIAEETLKSKEIVRKREYAKKYFPDDAIAAYCFCCEYSYKRNLDRDDNKCGFCPIDWGSRLTVGMCEDKESHSDNEGLYSLWCDTEDWKEASELARQIAELPERQV